MNYELKYEKSKPLHINCKVFKPSTYKYFYNYPNQNYCYSRRSLNPLWRKNMSGFEHFYDFMMEIRVVKVKEDNTAIKRLITNKKKQNLIDLFKNIYFSLS